MTLTSHIASLNRHTLKFLGVGLMLTWCQPFAVQGLPKSGNSDSCPPKQAILKHKINFAGQTVNFCLQHVTYILKAIGLTVNLVYLGTLYVHPVTCQIFRNIVNCENELAVLAETGSYSIQKVVRIPDDINYIIKERTSPETTHISLELNITSLGPNRYKQNYISPIVCPKIPFYTYILCLETSNLECLRRAGGQKYSQ